MSGIYRFALASLVVTFHAGFRPLQLSIGVSAVVAFYILSGFAMTGLWDSHYKTRKKSFYFYLERFIRIFPQYYFWLLITLVLTFGLNWWFPGYEEKEISFKVLLNAFLLIPYALGIYLPETIAWNPIGVTTSLANEEIFYLIAPLLFTLRKSFFAIAIASFFFFFLSIFDIIAINVFSYFYFPGPMVFLFIGHLIYRRDSFQVSLYGLAILSMICVSAITGNISDGYNREIFVGIILGTLAPFLIGKKHETQLSKILGNASYGMFLGHTAVLIVLKQLNCFDDSKFLFGVTWYLVSIIAGWCSYMVIEKPTLMLRLHIRSRAIA